MGAPPGVGAPNLAVDPARLARIEFIVEDLLESHGRANPPTQSAAGAPFDNPPLFLGMDVAALIEQALLRVANDVKVASEDVVEAHGANPQMAAFDGVNIDGSSSAPPATKPTPAMMALQVKLKTSNAIISEMGKRVDRYQRAVSDLSGRLAVMEQERAENVGVISLLRERALAFKIKAETAEAAINVFERVHPTLPPPQSDSEEEDGSGDEGDATDSGGGGAAAGGRASGRLAAQQRDGMQIRVPTPGFARKKKRKGKKVRVQAFAESETRQVADAPAAAEEMYEDSSKFLEDVPSDGDGPATAITRGVIVKTARMLAAKKRYDPPTKLGVGLKSSIAKEEHFGATIMSRRHLRRNPHQMEATTYRNPKVSRLFQAATDHAHHLSTVLSSQTQELLATTTPDSYIRVLHSQLSGMTRALHDCIDALAEEQRVSDQWRAKWIRSQIRLEVDQERRTKEERRNAITRGAALSAASLSDSLRPVLTELITPAAAAQQQARTKSALRGSAGSRRARSAESGLPSSEEGPDAMSDMDDHRHYRRLPPPSSASNSAAPTSASTRRGGGGGGRSGTTNFNRPTYQNDGSFYPDDMMLPAVGPGSGLQSPRRSRPTTTTGGWSTPAGNAASDVAVSRATTAADQRASSRKGSGGATAGNGSGSATRSARPDPPPTPFTAADARPTSAALLFASMPPPPHGEKEGRVIEFSLPDAGEKRFGRFKAMIPTISNPGPFHGSAAGVAGGHHHGGRGNSLMKAFTSHPAGSTFWETSGSIGSETRKGARPANVISF
ncbi:hypothetical protein HK101_010319 [Irineochytrium annulatum]|nr:hypothetical protein HK101_010319 [Irineochytrium annulatum]